ncbi:MAG: hypothetical protein WC728_06165 [Elusimicrobiota bacterium]
MLGRPVSERLDGFTREAAREPLSSRRELYGELLRCPTYLLHCGEKPVDGTETRSFHSGDTFSVWADPDCGSGGVWIPVFSREEHVSAFVAQRGLAGQRGEHWQWMRHDPGRVYGLLHDVPCLSGILLSPGISGGVRLEWPEVDALSAGHPPDEAPVLYEMPAEGYRIPEGTDCRWGELDGELSPPGGRQLLFPEAGRPERHEFRRLVRLRLEGAEPAWTPCRHLTAALRSFARRCGDAPEYEALLLAALAHFGMAGEAEAACRRAMARRERRPIAFSILSKVLLRSGRLDECVEVCKEGMAECPEERSLYLHRTLAHAQLEDLDAAREVARGALSRFPECEELERFL